MSAFLPAYLVSPHVLVSPKGVQFGTGSANYSSILNDGAAWGPDTLQNATSPTQYGPPYSPTSGIQEALNSLPSGGGAVFLIATAPFRVSGQISLPTNAVLRSEMYGGQNPSTSPSPPLSSINYSGSASDAVLVPDNSAKCGLIGVAIIGAATNALVHRRGCRQSFFIDCYIDNSSSTGSGTILDSPATGNGIVCDDNTASRCFIRGTKRAIGIGIADGTLHPSNSTWWDILGEVSGAGNNVVDGAAGDNHQFFNFYSRAGTTGAIFSGASGFKIVGGELLNSAATTTGSSSSKQVALISGGDWQFRDVSITAGSVNATAGNVFFHAVRVNSPPSGKSVGPFAFNGATLSLYIDRECNLGALGAAGLKVGSATTNVYLDTTFPSWDPSTVLSPSGSAAIHPSSPSSPPPPAPVALPFTNTQHNLVALMMYGGTDVTAVLMNGSPAGINQTTGPWFFLLRYRDSVVVAAGIPPNAAFYEVT